MEHGVINESKKISLQGIFTYAKEPQQSLFLFEMKTGEPESSKVSFCKRCLSHKQVFLFV